MTVLQFAKMRQFKNFSPPVALIYSAAATSTFFTIGHKGYLLDCYYPTIPSVKTDGLLPYLQVDENNSCRQKIWF